MKQSDSKKKYKAIISDIDGTLTGRITQDASNYPLPSKRVTDVIKKATKEINFAVATSRSLPLTNYLLDYLKLKGPNIVQNGALIVDGVSKKVLWEKFIELQDYYKVVEYLNEKHFSFVIDEKTKSAIPFSKIYIPKEPIVIFASELSSKEAKMIQEDLADISTIALHLVPSWTHTKFAINITNSEVSKQHAILEMAKILKISPDEMIGIGDGYNDFSLLMACGLKVAMGNAVDELKEIADYIAPSVDDDGVADVIEKFVL